MSNFFIPESLKSYYAKGDKNPVKRAVDALVDQLDGKTIPDLDWEETQDYNKALLMTAQVRADYCAMLFRIWDATFGKCKVKGPRDHWYFYEDEHSPAKLWENSCCSRDIYRNGDPDDDGPNDELYVNLENKKVELHVWRYKDDDNIYTSDKLPNVKSWKVKKDEGGDAYLKTKNGVTIEEFILDPDPAIAALKKQAADMAAALLKK